MQGLGYVELTYNTPGHRLSLLPIDDVSGRRWVRSRRPMHPAIASPHARFVGLRMPEYWSSKPIALRIAAPKPNVPTFRAQGIFKSNTIILTKPYHAKPTAPSRDRTQIFIHSSNGKPLSKHSFRADCLSSSASCATSTTGRSSTSAQYPSSSALGRFFGPQFRSADRS